MNKLTSAPPPVNVQGRAWCECCGNDVPTQLSAIKVCSLPCAEWLVEDARSRAVGGNDLARYMARRDRLRVTMEIPVARKPKRLGRPTIYAGAAL